MKEDIKIISDIFHYIKSGSGNILEKTETYESFHVIKNYYELDLLEDVDSNDRQSVLVSMAISYLNLGYIYAKKHLSPKDYESFQMWIQIYMDQDTYDEFGCYDVYLLYTKNGRNGYDMGYMHEVQWNTCKLYPIIKQVQGLSGFSCFEETYVDCDGHLVTTYHLFAKNVG